jgi:hypothetical protein
MVFAVLGFGFQQVAFDKKIRDEIFPTKEEMPEIDMKWAVRGNAMHILRHRTIEEAIPSIVSAVLSVSSLSGHLFVQGHCKRAQAELSLCQRRTAASLVN